MTRLVQGADGRMWTVRGRMSWSSPATSSNFELDVAAGYTPGFVLMGLLGALALVLVIWTPDRVIFPFWLLLILFLLLSFFPVRWALRRPWTLVAETPGDLGEHPAERWVGTVRGVMKVRGVMAKMVKQIESHSLPDMDGPLQPVE